jgi:glycosyltransferase involved in cell wall biosynthesis
MQEGETSATKDQNLGPAEAFRRLSIVLPAYNEEGILAACLERLLETFAGPEYEIVVVNNGSADRTSEIAHDYGRRHPGKIVVLDLDVNRYIGGGLKAGFEVARGQYVTTCAADFHYTEADWAPFAQALGSADVLVGCRMRREGYNPLMRFNSWLYVRLVHALFGLRLRDVNWICVYPRKLLETIEIKHRGIPMLVEILVKLRDLGATFREVDCRMQERTVGKASASRFRTMWHTLLGLLKLRAEYRASKKAHV